MKLKKQTEFGTVLQGSGTVLKIAGKGPKENLCAYFAVLSTTF